MSVYLITGASGDIGSAIALSCAKAGHTLALCGGKNTETLEKTTEACRACGVMTKTYSGDLSDEAFVSGMMQDLLHTFSRLDGLIHCAGRSTVGLITDLSLPDWSHLLQCNLTSAFLTARAAIPAFLKQQTGRILFVSSVWGERGASCEAAYSATKGGLNSLTKALAKELAPSGISVNAIAPGMVDTKMNAVFSEEDKALICEDIPAGRMTTPSELAEMVRLLMQAPVYLTGQVIGFDGGWF